MNNTNKNENIPALKKGNSFTTSTAEKANVLGAHFAKVVQVTILSPFKGIKKSLKRYMRMYLNEKIMMIGC